MRIMILLSNFATLFYLLFHILHKVLQGRYLWNSPQILQLHFLLLFFSKLAVLATGDAGSAGFLRDYSVVFDVLSELNTEPTRLLPIYPQIRRHIPISDPQPLLAGHRVREWTGRIAAQLLGAHRLHFKGRVVLLLLPLLGHLDHLHSLYFPTFLGHCSATLPLRTALQDQGSLGLGGSGDMGVVMCEKRIIIPPLSSNG